MLRFLVDCCWLRLKSEIGEIVWDCVFKVSKWVVKKVKEVLEEVKKEEEKKE